MASNARCSWCGGQFVRVVGVYWCESPACRDRQALHSIGLENQSTGDYSYLYVPLPKQVDFDSKPVRYLLGGGAAGASKSHMARYGIYRRLIAIPGYEALILRNTWDELDKHHLRLMEKEAIEFQKFGIDAHFAKTAREFTITHPDGTKSIIEGGHMDDPKDVDKFLSRERDAIVADEGVKFNPQHLLELSTRARSTKPAVEAFARAYQYRDWPLHKAIPGGGAVMWVLTNPGGPSTTMLRELFIDKQPTWENYSAKFKDKYDPSQWGYVAGNLEDNPYLPESYEADLAVLQEWRYKQLRHNDWDVVAGQFFTEFDTKVHVKDLGDPGGNVEWFRSMDWGYVSPGCVLWWACMPDGVYYIRYEWKFSHLTIYEVADEIKRRTKEPEDGSPGIDHVRYTVADPSTRQKYGDTGESISETFSRGPCYVPLTMGDNNRVSGWQRIRELFRIRDDESPTLVIHPSCRYLIRTLASATSDKSNPEDVDSRIDDHALDTLRYGAMSRPAPTRKAGIRNKNSFNANRQRIIEARRASNVR